MERGRVRKRSGSVLFLFYCLGTSFGKRQMTTKWQSALMKINLWISYAKRTSLDVIGDVMKNGLNDVPKNGLNAPITGNRTSNSHEYCI